MTGVGEDAEPDHAGSDRSAADGGAADGVASDGPEADGARSERTEPDADDADTAEVEPSEVGPIADDTRPERRRSRPLAVRGAAAVIAATLCLAGGYVLAGDGEAAAHPGDNSAAAGFARDMQQHHDQAVRMSMVVRDRTDDDRVRSLAYDIALTQQQQIGQMYAWLDQWNLPQVPAGRPLAWMGDGAGGHGHGAGPPGSTPGEDGAGPPGQPDEGGTGEAEEAAGTPDMPGMATKAQLRELEQAEGRDAEVLFLQLMISHHEAGVWMAQAALIRTDNPQVRRLAATMVTGQSEEIKLMREMLRTRQER